MTLYVANWRPRRNNEQTVFSACRITKRSIFLEQFCLCLFYSCISIKTTKYIIKWNASSKLFEFMTDRQEKFTN